VHSLVSTRAAPRTLLEGGYSILVRLDDITATFGVKPKRAISLVKPTSWVRRNCKYVAGP
jgi:hypothetical protein